jgi:uncharacterized protein (TIGR02246 family)
MEPYLPGAISPDPADERAVRQIVVQLIEAWNSGRGDLFAAPFTKTADFVAFEGTHLHGRQEVEAFHQQLFDTSLRGTRLNGDAKFVHFLTPALAVMHGIASMTLAGHATPIVSRESM